MKNTYKLNLIFAALFLGVIVFAFSAFNVKENNTVKDNTSVSEKHRNSALQLIENKKSTAANFTSVNLFKKSSKDNKAVINSALSEGVVFELDRIALSQLYLSKNENITLIIPGDKSNTEVELTQVNFMPDDFKIHTSEGKIEDYKRGLYYQGIIKGNNNSMAAISIFENEIIGIIATENGNYNLGAMQNDNNRYVYYNDRHLLKEFNFNCGVEDGYGKHYRNNNNDVTPKSTNSSTTNPVKMYYVCDYQMYLDRSSNTQNVVNYVTAVFNQENVLYNNDGLNLQLASQMVVYTNPDPYRTYTTSQTEEILVAFGTDIKNNIGGGGNLAQLLSTRTPVQGAIAWVNVLCQSYEPGSHSGRYAFIELENTYNNVPIYSWSVEVMAHETGHNFGSSHTQACVWPTISGQIDSCVDSEGGCVVGTRPNFNGTIMSYCHLNGAINFTLGFGPLPKDTITLRYNQALCIDNPLNSSEVPVAYNLLQNYPNPFNPSTNIKFALPDAGLVTLKVYDITGKLVADLTENKYYPVGIFSVELDAAKLNLSSGVYLYRIDVTRDNQNVYSEIKKMVLVK